MFRFRIGGKNPDAVLARTYIDGQFSTKYYSYAVAKQESRGYGGPTHLYYNQFFTEYKPNPRAMAGGDWRAWAKGFPVFMDDDGEITLQNPGGYGIYQNTRANIPRGEIWNWQDNVVAGNAELLSKETIADTYLNGIKAQHPAKYNEDPPPIITVGSHLFSSWDAIAIHAYNGIPGGIGSKFPFNPDAPPGLGQGKRWYWNPYYMPDSDPPHYYINKVELEMEQ